MVSEIAWIVVVNFVLYFKTLRFKFMSDDLSVFSRQRVNPPKFKNKLHELWMKFTGTYKFYTKAPTFFKKDGKWMIAFPETEEMEHLVTLLIHTLICIMIYFAFGANTVSFIASLLYSVNPINNQATMWPAGRGYALPILSLLTAMTIHYLAPIFLYFCSWYTIGFLAPLTLIGSDRWWLLLFMPVIWFLHSRKWTRAIGNKASQESFDEDKKFGFHKVIIFLKTYGFYFTLCLIPFRITFYHNYLQSMAGSMAEKAKRPDRYFLIGLVFLISGIVYSILSWDTLAWAWLAFTIGIAPYCNVVRANQEIAERFCALPNVFLMYGLAQVISKI